MRYLTVSLFAEGLSDLLFLGAVLDRELRRLAYEGDGFAFDGVVREEVSTVTAAERLDDAVAESCRTYDLVLVHQDRNEASKIDALRGRLACVTEHVSHVLGVVPVRETEAWMLADRAAFAHVRGSDFEVCGVSGRELEKLPDPKAVLRTVCGFADHELFRQLGELVALERLAEVPAYRSFKLDLTNALKELNFL
jgi:hypothetical protein